MGGEKSTQRQPYKSKAGTAKLVMGAFYRVANRNGIRAEDITSYLQEKFGEIWQRDVLTARAREALEMSAALGFLRKDGDKFVADVVRQKKQWASGRSRRPAGHSGGGGVRKRSLRYRRS